MKQPNKNKPIASNTNPRAATAAVVSKTTKQKPSATVPLTRAKSGTSSATKSLTSHGEPMLTTSATIEPASSPSTPNAGKAATTPAVAPISATLAAATPSGIPSDADPPPSVTLPAVPKAFQVPNMREFRGYYPTKAELVAMPGAVTDLGRFADYATVLGSSVTDPATLAAAMTLGIKWRALRDASEAWDTYVKAQDGIAWKEAFTIIDEVRPIFQFALVKNPSSPSRLSALPTTTSDANDVA